MTTLNQLKEVSLRHFAVNGYDGTSLADIANDVGIKKQSIYTYFTGKDDMFLQICEDTCKNELSMVMKGLELVNEKSLKEILYTFLEQSIARFTEYDSTKFMLRNTFLPPTHLHEEVMKMAYKYLDHLEELFLPIFKQAKETGEIRATIDAEIATAAFLGVLDSLYIEMLYGDAHRLQKRFDASWSMFWSGLRVE